MSIFRAIRRQRQRFHIVHMKSVFLLVCAFIGWIRVSHSHHKVFTAHLKTETELNKGTSQKTVVNGVLQQQQLNMLALKFTLWTRDNQESERKHAIIFSRKSFDGECDNSNYKHTAARSLATNPCNARMGGNIGLLHQSSLDLLLLLLLERSKLSTGLLTILI